MRAIESSPFADFPAAAEAALKVLRERLDFSIWMVTRKEGDDQIVLYSDGQGYDVGDGTVFSWADGFCSQMVAGDAPRVAPRSDEVPAFANSVVRGSLQIGAYIGAPLTRADGSVFGSLCAIHPTPQSDAIVRELPLVELTSRMLSTILNTELAVVEQARRAERAEALADTDALTGLFNRRGWDSAVDSEESRSQRYGSPACVVIVDLDRLKVINDAEGHAAGDRLIAGTAAVLRDVCRDEDIIARIGGDEFAVLGVECDAEGAARMVQRIEQGLAQAGIEATLGMARRVPGKGLADAWREADKAMYRRKHGGRA